MHRNKQRRTRNVLEQDTVRHFAEVSKEAEQEENDMGRALSSFAKSIDFDEES
ncbi:MAG TPA: hypothetical protein VF493_06830 [Terriglobales bacterium]